MISWDEMIRLISLKGGNHLGDLGIDRRRVLKRVFKEYSV
jgi:hypothetical protein